MWRCLLLCRDRPPPGGCCEDEPGGSNYSAPSYSNGNNTYSSCLGVVFGDDPRDASNSKAINESQQPRPRWVKWLDCWQHNVLLWSILDFIFSRFEKWPTALDRALLPRRPSLACLEPVGSVCRTQNTCSSWFPTKSWYFSCNDTCGGESAEYSSTGMRTGIVHESSLVSKSLC